MGSAKRRLFLRKYGHERPSTLLSRREKAAFDLLTYGEVLVEVGCGTGALLRASAAKFNSAIGLDLMEERVRLALKTIDASNVQFLVADMDSGLPFRDGSLSCVVCVAAFEYAYDPFYFLDEVRRVLVPAGSLILQVANLVWLPRRISLLGGRLPPTGSPSLMQDRSWNGGYLHAYTLHDLRALVNACGFITAELVSSGRLGMASKLWPSLLSSDFVILCRKR